MRLFTRIMLLGGLAFLGYANLDLLNSSVNLIRKVQVATTAGVEMRNICRAVVMHYINTHEIPLRNFSQFLRENMEERSKAQTRDRACDMWGTPYVLTIRDVNIIVWSAGPDKKWRTEDDLSCTESLAKVELPDIVRADIRKALSGGTGSRTPPGTTKSSTASRSPLRPRRRRRFHKQSGWRF